MNWIIGDSNNLLITLCGIFYSILCVFSIVFSIITGGVAITAI